MEAQTFEMRRLPQFRYPNLFWIWLGLAMSRNSVLSWCAVALLAGWVIYRLRGPAPVFILSETEIGPSGGKHLIPRHEVEEIYPSTHGLTVAWKRNGVPRYSEVHAVAFDEEVWWRARAALLIWGNREAANAKPRLV
jgi:hypothetical protein